jgi:hypothetical protein
MQVYETSNQLDGLFVAINSYQFTGDADLVEKYFL